MTDLLHRIKIFVYRFRESQPDYLLLRPAGPEGLWGPIQGPIGFGEKLETREAKGHLELVRQHLEDGIARDTPAQPRTAVFRLGRDLGVACRVNAAQTLWLLGYPEQALARLHEALALAHELSHPYSLGFVRVVAAWVSQFRRDVPAVHEHAEAAVALSNEQGFPQWAAYGMILRGWALAMQGQGEAGLVQLRQGLAAVVAMGSEIWRSLCLVLLAEAAGHIGQVEEGLGLLAEALTVLEATEQGDMLAEAYRLQGGLLLRQATPDTAQAEACFQQALAIARRQQAKSWELRAAMSLSRLWQQQGKRAEAYDLLVPIYGWFTEGFDTADLQEAKALLEDLGG